MEASVLEAPAILESSLRDDEPLFEIIDGQRVELPPMSLLSNILAGRLFMRIARAAENADSGWPLIETLVHLPLPVDRNRRPDVAFVSYLRWSKDRPIPETGTAMDAAPDLAAEFVSPTDLAEELEDKRLEYFQSGAKLVWLIYPIRQLVHVFDSPISSHVLTRNDVLDGGSVLPEFKLPLAALFPAPAGV